MSTQGQDAGPVRAAHARALAIDARELVKTYPKEIRALDGLSFTVQEGTVFGLLGPNGAGKSTTVKILTTLAQPDSGSASVAGLDVRSQGAAVRRATGVVAQRSGADPTATGRENLLLSGARYPGGAAGLIVLLVVSVLVAVVFSALSNTIGMLARERETIIGLSVFLLLPLTFLSSAFMAPALMPHWMRIVADCNPVNWALEAARAAMSAAPDWARVLAQGGGLLALAVAVTALSVLTFRAYQKSV